MHLVTRIGICKKLNDQKLKLKSQISAVLFLLLSSFGDNFFGPLKCLK